MVVMGFGLGALLMAKLLAPIFLNYFENSLPKTFLAIGIIMLVFLPLFANFSINACTRKTTEVSTEKVNPLPEIFSKNFIFIWVMFTFAVIAGMIFISFQSPLLQDLLKAEGLTDQLTLEHKGATLILSALFNGLGRFVWGSASDKLGRINTFRILLIVEALVFAGLIFTKNPMIFSVGVCIVLLNYGGALELFHLW
jgi:OFA family oxalate/formate antiporter-like MFS transporter